MEGIEGVLTQTEPAPAIFPMAFKCWEVGVGLLRSLFHTKIFPFLTRRKDRSAVSDQIDGPLYGVVSNHLSKALQNISRYFQPEAKKGTYSHNPNSVRVAHFVRLHPLSERFLSVLCGLQEVAGGCDSGRAGAGMIFLMVLLFLVLSPSVA